MARHRGSGRKKKNWNQEIGNEKRRRNDCWDRAAQTKLSWGKKKKTRKEDEEKDHNGNAEFPKGSIHSETTLKCIIKLWHSVIPFVSSQKQESAAAVKWKTFLLIPVGPFRCSSLGIQGHHYQNLQKLLSAIILNSVLGWCADVALTWLDSNLCLTSLGFWREWAVRLF